MQNAEPRDGLVLLCDLNGVIQQVVTDDLDITRGQGIGRSFVNLVSSDNIKQAFAFVEALQSGEPALGWGLYTLVEGERTLVNLNGYALERELIITGARSRVVATQLYHKMLRSHHAQLNSLHATLLAERTAHDNREKELLAQIGGLQDSKNTLQEMLSTNVANVTGDLAAATDIARQITDLTLTNKRLQSELTAAREAKAAVTNADSAFTTVFRAAPVAMCISARNDGRLVYVNEQFERMLGYRIGELAGQSFYRLLAQGTRATIGKIEAQLAVPHSPIEIPTRLRNHAGEVLDVVAGFELMELNGEACIVTAVHLNSERVQTAQDMAEQEQIRRDLSGQVAGLQREVDMLREELRNRRSVDATATQQVNALRDQVKKLEAEIASADQREHDLRQQIATYQPTSREQVLKAQIANLQSNEQTLNGEFANLRARISQLEGEIEEHKQRLQEQTGQVTAAQRLNFRIEALHNAVQSELRAQVESLLQDKANLEQEVAKLRQTEEELSHLSTALLEEAGMHEQTTGTFQQREQELLANINALQVQIADLESGIDKRDQLLAEQAPLLAAHAEALEREIDARHTMEARLKEPPTLATAERSQPAQATGAEAKSEGNMPASDQPAVLAQITRLEGYVRESEVLTETLVELARAQQSTPASKSDATAGADTDDAPQAAAMQVRHMENRLATMVTTEDELRKELATYHQKEQHYLSQIASLSAEVGMLTLELEEAGYVTSKDVEAASPTVEEMPTTQAVSVFTEEAQTAPHSTSTSDFVPAVAGLPQEELLHELVVLNTKEKNYKQQVADLTADIERLQQLLAAESQAKESAHAAAAEAQRSAEAATIAARMSAEAAALASIPLSVPESIGAKNPATAPAVPTPVILRQNPFAELALSQTDLHTMLKASADALQKQMAVRGTCILLMDAAQQNLIPSASSGIYDAVFPVIPFERSELSTSEPVLITGRAIGDDEQEYTTVALPLLTTTATVGVVLASYDRSHLLQTEEVERADEMAHDLAAALAHVLARTESQRRLDDLAVVYRAALRLHPIKNADGVAQEVKGVLEETFRHELAEIMLADAATGELTPFMIAQRGRPYEPFPLAPAAPNKFIAAARREAAATVVKSGHSIRRDKISSGPQAGMALLCVPIWIAGRAGGALYLETTEENAFTAIEQQRLEMLALPLGTSIRNAQAVLALEEQLDQLRHLNVQLAGGEDATRRQMAQQLQMNVGQNLTMLSIYLDNLHNDLPGDTSSLVAIKSKNSQRLVDDISKNVRDVIAELHPPALDEVGLAGALRWYGGRFSERTGVPAIINSNQWVRRLSPTTEAVLFRIAQETLATVENADPVKPIRITLNDTGTLARLSITGGGVALVPDKHASVLARSRERAAAIGGELRIENATGEEPQVVVEVGSDALAME